MLPVHEVAFSCHGRLCPKRLFGFADAPLSGRVVTQYPDTRQNSNAIFDYTHVAMELISIWANVPAKTEAAV